MITNPISSLALVQSVLQRFSPISYYKVNKNKSFILDLGIDGTTSNLLCKLYPYPWAYTGITYLGITLTKSTKALFKNNYIDARHMLLQETAKLSKFTFSWSGWLATFNMLILPRLLYIFCTLPLPHPHTYLKSFQSILHYYVWQGIQARCSHARLIKHRLVGDTGYTYLIDYHVVTVLSQLKDWMSPTPTTLWVI